MDITLNSSEFYIYYQNFSLNGQFNILGLNNNL